MGIVHFLVFRYCVTVCIETETLRGHFRKGNPGSVIVPLVDSCKITVFVWGKVALLKSVGNKSH